MVRFGQQADIKGVLGGTPEADRLIGYLTKYLTKSVDTCHEMTTERQTTHFDRFWHELRYTPCSSRCPNWLRYGVQPEGVKAHHRAGRCKARVHQRPTLGLGGRRVLVSRQWSGKSERDREIAAGMDRRIDRAVRKAGAGERAVGGDAGAARGGKRKGKRKGKRRDDGEDGSSGVLVQVS